MKIALVNHTFPPQSVAGSELCVLYLAQELQRAGHDVCVFYRIHDPERPEYVLVENHVDGIPTTAIVHSYRHQHSFQDIYHNPVISARFGAWLQREQPDVVHFHHLTNLSLSMVDEARHAGAVTVMTLHDYWLLCQRGQLLQEDLSCCSGPSAAKCRVCLSPQLLKGRVGRLANRLRQLAGLHTRFPAGLLDTATAEIHTSQKAFVQWTRFGLGDNENETLQMHPDSTIRIPVDRSVEARFTSRIGLHPSTYDSEGSGVWFVLSADDEELLRVGLDPKHRHEDRGWHRVDVRVPPCRTLSLQTMSMDGRGHYCTAGWNRPVLSGGRAEPVARPKRSGWGMRLARWLVHLAPEAHEGIAHRRNHVQRVLEGVDHLISPSIFLKEFFVRNGVPDERISVMANGFPEVDAPTPRPVRHPVRFGYLGTWIPSKGIDLLLEAFRDISPDEALLTVHGFFPGYAGHEDYEERLMSLAGPAVTLGGRYEHADVQSLLRQMDCLVVPSIWVENSPMTIQEAFQAGVSVLTADVGGMAEQVRSGGGWTFRHRDVESLRQTLLALIRDPGKIEAERKRIPQVPSIRQQSGTMLELYSTLRERKPAR